MPLYLTEVRRIPEERKLHLTWSDGHSADFDADYLRGYCPCATCQGHGALEVTFRAPRKSVSIGGVEAVGNYAISLAFSDGHATGIYRFDFLREICPCPMCKGAAARTLAEDAARDADA